MSHAADGPPVAKQSPHQRTVHGRTSEDPWSWLRDREDPDTLAYLEAENAFTRAQMAHTEALQTQLFEEIRSRIQETDLSVPVRKGPWWYYSRTEEGRQYAISCRRPAVGRDRAYDETAPEQVILDQNVEAEGHEFFSLGVFDVSLDHRLLAYAVDTTGGERYHLRFRDLERGVDLPDEVPDVYYGSAWAADSRHLFYVRPDDAMRPHQLWRHRLGTPGSRRRARPPGGRRALLPRHRPDQGRAVPRAPPRLQGHRRVPDPRRGRPHRRVPGRRAAPRRTSSTASSTTATASSSSPTPTAPRTSS